MDLLPAGHLCLSGASTALLIRSGEDIGRESLASALCLRGEEGERTGDESLPQVVY